MHLRLAPRDVAEEKKKLATFPKRGNQKTRFCYLSKFGGFGV